MKKENQAREIERLRKEIRDEIEHWKEINKNGCNDPFWPDGTNMNLTRNHIIYAKRQISEICERHGVTLPEEMYLPSPPEVNNYYMANLKQKRRVELIGHREKITTKKSKYDEEQLTLF